MTSRWSWRKSGISAGEMSGFGSQLAQMVPPRKINELLGQELGAANGNSLRPLVVVHDAAMSRVPWETLQIGGTSPALDGGLTHRYDGGIVSVAKWREEGPQTQGVELSCWWSIRPVISREPRRRGERVEKAVQVVTRRQLSIVLNQQESYAPRAAASISIGQI